MAQVCFRELRSVPRLAEVVLETFPMMESNSPMIERVARALAASLHGDDWRAFVPAARAAVTAMREPTPAMLDAALPELPDCGFLPDDWRAMIDQIAGERVFPTAHKA